MLKLHVMLCILYSALINGLNGTSIELGFNAMFPLFALLPFLSDGYNLHISGIPFATVKIEMQTSLTCKLDNSSDLEN